jgi:hypothetical protein
MWQSYKDQSTQYVILPLKNIPGILKYELLLYLSNTFV